MPKTITIDPSQPVEVSFLPQSPHVFAYRVWCMAPAAKEWNEVASGGTADDRPDEFRIPNLWPGSKLAYFVAVSGRQQTPFRATLRLAQGGRPLPEGDCLEEGVTGPDELTGYAERSGEVVFA